MIHAIRLFHGRRLLENEQVLLPLQAWRFALQSRAVFCAPIFPRCQGRALSPLWVRLLLDSTQAGVRAESGRADMDLPILRDAHSHLLLPLVVPSILIVRRMRYILAKYTSPVPILKILHELLADLHILQHPLSGINGCARRPSQ